MKARIGNRVIDVKRVGGGVVMTRESRQGGSPRVPLGKPHRKMTDGVATPGHEATLDGGHKTGRRATPIPACRPPTSLSYIVYGQPVPKPRMTRRDKWQQRPCVMIYRAWKDVVRRNCPQLPSPGSLSLTAHFFLARPKSRTDDQPHTVKPDLDNLVKGLMDALLVNDQIVHQLQATKHWDDGRGPRVELTIQTSGGE